MRILAHVQNNTTIKPFGSAKIWRLKNPHTHTRTRARTHARAHAHAHTHTHTQRAELNVKLAKIQETLVAGQVME